jgi:hypothetical protein
MPFDNERLKRNEIGDYPIDGDDNSRSVDGMWVPESNDPGKVLVFREQVRITCTKQKPISICHEIKVPLGVIPELVMIMSIEEGDWPVTSWDARGLIASYGADDTSYGSLSDKCFNHVLTMTFQSGAVFTSDIPTRGKGCEAFTETHSYRLVRGNYYVDTKPASK